MGKIKIQYINTFFKFIKKYGWKGWFCNKYCIISKSHPFYIDGLKDGLEDGSEYGLKDCSYFNERRLLSLIMNMQNFPSYDPPRTRNICYLNGLKDAYRIKYGDLPTWLK